MWGDRQYGKLGNNTSTDICITPTIIGSRFISFSCGDQHTIAINDKYEVYSWGDNEFGQLGHGTSDFLNFAIPNHILFLK